MFFPFLHENVYIVEAEVPSASESGNRRERLKHKKTSQVYLLQKDNRKLLQQISG